MILLNDFKRQWHATKDATLAAFSEVGESGWYILGAQVRSLEKALAELWGVRGCVGVASGLDALEISLKVLGCRQGDRVLTTPISAFATTLAILKIGAIPVFADTDRFGLLDLEGCETLLGERPDIRFLLPVHLYGHALDMRRMCRIRERFGCKIVEDCAQSVGASFNGSQTGQAGHMAATSFYPTKNLGVMGDGGAILTNSDEWCERARCLRDYGQTSKYTHDVVGYNSRLDELHSSFLLHVALPLLNSWIARRRVIAERYCAEIRNKKIRIPGAPPNSNSCWHLFPVYIAPEQKSDFMADLKGQGILSGEHYPFLIPEQAALSGLDFELCGELVNARNISQSEVSLPIHPYLTDDEVSQVIEVCNRWKR